MFCFRRHRDCLQRFGTECRKTKAKVITQPITTNTIYPMNQSELEANADNRHQARENACEQVAIDLSFSSDWSSKTKAKRELLSTQLKTALSSPIGDF